MEKNILKAERKVLPCLTADTQKIRLKIAKSSIDYIYFFSDLIYSKLKKRNSFAIKEFEALNDSLGKLKTYLNHKRKQGSIYFKWNNLRASLVTSYLLTKNIKIKKFKRIKKKFKICLK